MKRGGVSLLTLFLIHVLLFFGFVAAEGDSKGIRTPNTSGRTVDSSGAENSPPIRVKGDEEKKDINQDGKAQQETTTNPLIDTEKNMSEGEDKHLEKPKASSGLSKESLDEGSSNNKKTPIADSHATGCDPSNRCIDKKTNLVACLRVPGTDTQALSLVIQNKGKNSLDVKIIAPSFVHLEQVDIHVKAEGDKEVKINVNEDSAKDSMIILQPGGGDNCSLAFRNIIPNNSISKSETFILPRFISAFTGFALVCIVLTAAVIMGMAWLCIKFRRFLPQEISPKYQKLEVGLPVSTGGKKEGDDGGDNWDISWGNGWDEEDAPMTPSKTVSNPSLKGLASRRFNKDGWRD